MTNFFRYGKLSSESSIDKGNTRKKKYDDYKKEIIDTLNRHIELVEDPGKLIRRGKHKDPPYIMTLSYVADDFSFIELTLRCGSKLFDFGGKNEKYFKYIVPVEARTATLAKTIRIALLHELVERVENDEYKAQIKAFIRRQAKQGIDEKKGGWYC
ncbi:conserved hypothetical protein [Candidatus Methylobacter favarea]|uniref:Uncharacterized protein n=1 Tax=Candidatus Methylobacter favarea TaxID=2707345 RepID=A0A8S0Y6T7_9GAMM|nr:hypothetical protein [Candidatus Methylobacter favarea]CAA9892159.1 conserved hypothetical protein [Candidatus Methylobacter favarea]